MVEQICPECQHENPLENRFCSQCGASLTSYSIAPRRESSLTLAGLNLPAAQLKQLGQSVAVGLLAIAAEAGLAWLRRRVGQVDATPRMTNPRVPPPAAAPETSLVPLQSQTTRRIVSVFSRQMVAVWSEDGLIRQTVERATWWRES